MPPFANAGPVAASDGAARPLDTLVNRVVAQRLSHFIGSMPILLPLGGSVAEVRRTQEKTLLCRWRPFPGLATPSSFSVAAFATGPGPPPFSFHAAAWSMIGSILSSFLPISRLAISTS
jgi:hypothetical protein